MEVPPELKGRYLERRQNDLKVCWASFKKANFNILQKVGHQLKGSAETFGHGELSEIGAELETAAIKKDSFLIHKTLKEFSRWVGEHSN